VLSVLSVPTAAPVNGDAPPLDLMDALSNLHTHLVLVHFSVPPRPAGTTTTSQRRVIVCSSAAAQRAVARALRAFEPRRNRSVVVEGLPRETTAEEVAQLLKRYCGDVCASNAVVEKIMPIGETGETAAVVTCPPLSDDCDDIVTALHGKRLISLRGPLCVYALELQYTKWAPNMEDF
jgi:hypothetical protein